ncbi:MAG: AarF/ABC1/UbiB kinase family protein [Candidatus Omnitrophica bacterium]|nr:AarF/ABC1/UbiB kinase family protein [Candidatus Omnitrophota bacterium]
MAKVFSKYGFGYFIKEYHLTAYVPAHSAAKDTLSDPLTVRFRKILEELGPTYIKLGQMLSLHPDIIPPEFCKEFEKLQDNVFPIEFEKIKDVLEKEYGKPLGEVFKDFPSTPLASASLAQVYKVFLGNKEAIVKVRKPGVEEIVRADLDLLDFLVKHLEKHVKELQAYNLSGLLEEFKAYILNELDFTNENINIEILRKNFLHDNSVHIPLVYQKYCTDKVLVIEYINGTKLSDIKRFKDLGMETPKIARTLTECILKQIFIDGVFHADPHPGNIFILAGGKISLVDFGVLGRIDDDIRFSFAHFFIAAATKDAELLMKVLQNTGAMGYADESLVKRSFQLLLDKYFGMTLEEFNMNDFLNDFNRIVYLNKIRVLPNNFLLFKTLGILESEAKMLDPTLNLMLEIKRMAERVVEDEYSIARIARKIGAFSADVLYLLQNFPRDLISIIDEIKNGRLVIGFEHRNLEGLIGMLDKASNRLSFSMLVAAIIIGSALLVHTSGASFLGSHHQLGIAGFVVAGALGLWLVGSIMRSGKL